MDPKVKSIRPLTEREELNMVDVDKKRSRIERLAEQIGLSPKEKGKRRVTHEREYYDFRFKKQAENRLLRIKTKVDYEIE